MQDACSKCGLTTVQLADTSDGLPAERLVKCRKCGVIVCTSACAELVLFVGARRSVYVCSECYMVLLVATVEAEQQKGRV